MQDARSIPFGKPIIGSAERAAVAEVLAGTQFVHGPRSRRFEADFADFAGGGHAVSVASCTAGLHLAYFQLGIGPGDEVIVPALTHVATAHAVEFTGARPVFADAEPATGNVDIDGIEAAITANTRAIGVVHYLGLPVDMDRVNAIAAKHGLTVVEDCALAVGSRFKGVHVGLLGDVGCFSFYPVKHMTTAEGGMVLTRHQEMAGEIALRRAFGVDSHAGERRFPGVYDVVVLGYNYRMNELEAALGVEQLKRVPGFLEKRAENFNALAGSLDSLDEVTVLRTGAAGAFESSHYCLAAVLEGQTAPRRQDLVAALKGRGIGTSVYYPAPVPKMTYYRDKYGFAEGAFPVASRLSSQSIALPVGPHLDTEDMAYIAQCLKDTIQEIAS